MKSDINIKDELFLALKGTSLATAVTGELLKTRRPELTKEDIISILANEGNQRQEAAVNVNIYVKDNEIDGQAEEDTIRLRELCGIAEETIKAVRLKGVLLNPSPPRVFEAEGICWHIISNRIRYEVINE